jgi:hypothetical protein
MAARERFADRSDSSCTAGAVHTWPRSSFALTQQIGSERSNSGHAVNVAATQMTLGGYRASMKDGALSRPLNEQRPDFTIAVLDHRTDTNAKAAVTPITGL